MPSFVRTGREPIATTPLDAPAPPWRHNPSSWRQRVPICVLAGIATLIATYMGLYQWRLIGSVWDPVFGAESAAVLDSDVSERMRRWIGVPDAILGAIAYLGDLLFGLAGCTRRWQLRPWMVVIFSIDVIPLGIVSAVLVVLQGTVVGAWCLLCLVTAVISLLLVVLAYDEFWSSWVYLRRAWRETRSARVVWDCFWGRGEASDALRAEVVREDARERAGTPGVMWARDLEVALAVWLAMSPFTLRHGPASAAGITDFACAALIALFALSSYWRPLRRAHLAELAVAAWLVGAGWLASRGGATPASQNHVVVGLVLAMLAIVPSESSAPPRRARVTRARAGSAAR